MYDENLMERFSLDVIDNTSCETFTEAVFVNGKNTVLPLVAHIQKIKDLLNDQITQQDTSIAKLAEEKKKKKTDKSIKSIPVVELFDPIKFWKDNVFKDFEDKLGSIFGFRNVEIHPYIEKYNSKAKIFESKIMNCEIYHSDRYPIEGIVTDKGFYDKSKSTIMQIHISLGLIKTLDAEEILAVLLHEFGHSIDPALVDIKYTEVNILSKYLTDRKDAINKDEKRLLKNHNLSSLGWLMLTYFLFFVFITAGSLISIGIIRLIDFISEKILGKDKVLEKKLNKVVKMVNADKSKFDRQTYSEAYADNFARMYGFGAPLMSGLKKVYAEQAREMKSRYKREKDRQQCILYITEMLIKDVHKTDIHRIRNLINEYKADLNDPNITIVTKKQIKEDLFELEKILDQYLNNFDDFQNRVNKTINDELSKMDDVDDKGKLIKEGFEFFDDMKLFEEKHPLQEKMESECPLDRGDLARIKEKFGDSRACSFAKDKNGYFAYTHRCRCKSYKTIDDMPQKDVDFVRSTS